MGERSPSGMSFGRSAVDYDRLRPGPPRAAVDWLLPGGGGGVVDLAAGTGALTRLLSARCRQVTAVEPDARMRAVLTDRCPEVRTLAGSGEHLPLADSCAHAVLVSSAWHWLDPALAVVEIARVLVPGGRFGVLWTRRDDDVPWVAELDAFVRGLVRDIPLREPCYQVDLPDGAPFTEVRTCVVRGTVERTPEELVGLYTTYGFFLRLPEAEQRRVRARLADHVARHPLLAAASRVALPLRSVCWRATRTG